MQRFLFSKRNQLTFISGAAIVLAFIAHLGFKQEFAAEILFIIASIVAGAPILLQAISSLRVKVVSIDVLVSIAIIGAFFIRNFEESAIVSFLFLFGSYLEQRTLSSTRSAIGELVSMAPNTAMLVQEDGSFEEVDIYDLDQGDIVLVRAGESIPVDGIVHQGEGHVNEASITGEPIPVGVEEGSEVFAGTILENGNLKVITEEVGEDTIFGKIIELVEDAQDSKSVAERFIDRFSRYYTPVVLILGLVVYIVTRNIELAITVLVLGCPGALVIGIPVSNVAGIGNGARNGILFKGSEVISDFSKVDTIIFDKTGTLTDGEPKITQEVYYGDEADREEILSLVKSIEEKSTHPLAAAIIAHYDDVPNQLIEYVDTVRGKGLVARAGDREMGLGNLSLMDELGIEIDQEQKSLIQQFEQEGNSLVLVGFENQLRLILGVGDKVRPGVKENLQKMRALGVKEFVILSGDNQGSVDYVAQQLGIDRAVGNMLPDEKSEYLKERQSKGEIVAFVGDGINDSPSLALADIGIAMGSGTDVAIETSDLVLVQSNFDRLAHGLGLTKSIVRNLRQNIFIALATVIILLYGLFFSSWVTMSVGMLVHEGSILAVILNGMRLLRYKLER